jgi:hypothetical protein
VHRSRPRWRRPLARVAGTPEAVAASRLVVALPEVVREQVEAALDRVALVALDVAADAAVQCRAEGVEVVGDLLRDGVLEQVRLVVLLVGSRDERRSSELRATSIVPSSG